MSIVDINNNPIKNVTFGAEIELLSSIENEKLIESKTINKISDNSGLNSPYPYPFYILSNSGDI